MDQQTTCSHAKQDISKEIRATHILVVPYPAQGHLGPLMKLAVCLVNHGVRVTLVTTEFIHGKLVDAVKVTDGGGSRVRVVSVHDGFIGAEDDRRRDETKVAENISRLMPCYVDNMIQEAYKQGNEKENITFLIADSMFEWAAEVAEKNKIKSAVFWTSSPGTLALALSIPRLIEAGLIDKEGTQLKEGNIEVVMPADLPTMSTTEFAWRNADDQLFQKTMFEYFCAGERAMKKPKWLLCNWFNELCPSAPNVFKNIVPVGPLLSNGHNAGTFKPEDATCLTWLDQQPSKSVIYIAFGSISVLSQQQLDELAHGLRLSKHRFLWVARSGLTDGESSSPVKYPDGFLDWVGEYGKIVEWAPQEMVLAHPSVSCFLTHCGWNSTMEGMSMGVPFLCWPCFADQFYIRTCICDAWKVGLSFLRGEDGIISRAEVVRKIDELVSRDDIRENSFEWKEIARRSIGAGGSSSVSVEKFLDAIRV